MTLPVLPRWMVTPTRFDCPSMVHSQDMDCKSKGYLPEAAIHHCVLEHFWGHLI